MRRLAATTLVALAALAFSASADASGHWHRCHIAHSRAVKNLYAFAGTTSCRVARDVLHKAKTTPTALPFRLDGGRWRASVNWAGGHTYVTYLSGRRGVLVVFRKSVS